MAPLPAQKKGKTMCQFCPLQCGFVTQLFTFHLNNQINLLLAVWQQSTSAKVSATLTAVSGRFTHGFTHLRPQWRLMSPATL